MVFQLKTRDKQDKTSRRDCGFLKIAGLINFAFFLRWKKCRLWIYTPFWHQGFHGLHSGVLPYKWRLAGKNSEVNGGFSSTPCLSSMSWQGVALKYPLPTPHHTYQWLSSNHADDSQLVAFIRCPVVFPPIGQSTAASLSVIHLGFVFGYHQLLFVIISILKINVFNGSSWWGWDACAFFQGDVLHVKRIDFSESRWISGLKTTCGTSNKSWVGNDSRWMKTLRILTWTCGVFILDSAELLAQEHASWEDLEEMVHEKISDIRYGRYGREWGPKRNMFKSKGRPNHLQEGSPDRIGFDQHVLPNLYAAAQGVYAARHDQAWRVKLLQAAPEERRCLDGHGIWDG